MAGLCFELFRASANHGGKRAHFACSWLPVASRGSERDALDLVLGANAVDDDYIRPLIAWCAVALSRWPDAAGTSKFALALAFRTLCGEIEGIGRRVAVVQF